jgi:hypothetical protein
VKWTDDEIARVVLSVSDVVMPSRVDLESQGLGGLAGTISKRGGFLAWAERLGLKPKGGGRKRGRVPFWTTEMVQEGLSEHVVRLGRLPTANELRIENQHDLMNAVMRHGGFRLWAKRLGVKQKGSETHRGQRWERHEAEFFRKLGFNVKEQTTKASFDLLVSGYRVDVKSATLNRWYSFGSIRRCEGCDFLDLLCVDGDAIQARFIIPAEMARVKQVSMMPKTLYGLGKYASFKDSIHLLKRATRLPF